MQFDTISAFFAMGGYAFYVWLSYGVTALAIVLLIILSKQKHKNTLLAINQRYTRELKRKEAARQQQTLKQNNSSSSEVVEKTNEPTP
jgi:heme exporter protein D